ncbi:MAG: hypothetical protein JNK72_24705 [Myxococcales bacterium]|nr:hypothetical protein [Myxococcales bacterium]
MATPTTQDLERVANQTRDRSLAYAATQRQSPPVVSTFTNGTIRGGATWYHGDPQGRIILVRISARRVWKDLQAACGAAPDAKPGGQTRTRLEQYTGLPVGTLPLTLIRAALRKAYHGDVGEVYVPTATQTPTFTGTEVTGDETYTSYIPLRDGAITGSEPEQTITRTPPPAVPHGATASQVSAAQQALQNDLLSFQSTLSQQLASLLGQGMQQPPWGQQPQLQQQTFDPFSMGAKPPPTQYQQPVQQQPPQSWQQPQQWGLPQPQQPVSDWSAQGGKPTSDVQAVGGKTSDSFGFGAGFDANASAQGGGMGAQVGGGAMVLAQPGGMTAPAPAVVGQMLPPVQPAPINGQVVQQGLSTGAWVAIGAGALAVVGVGAALVLRSPSPPPRPAFYRQR